MTSARIANAGSGPEVPISWPEPPTAPDGLKMDLGAEYRSKKHNFMGIGLSAMTDDQFVEAVRQAVATRSRLAVSFINPDYVIRGNKHGIVEKMNRFDIVLPDGWGIVYGSRLLGIPMPNRQGNGDICPKIFEMSDKQGYSNFLFGCSPGTPEKAAANVVERWSTAKIAGTLHGHWDMLSNTPGKFTKEDMDMMVDTINKSGADIVHVSLPTPMQQNWVWEVAERLNVPVFITGGSYLDHLGEAVDWYPNWMHTMRLCWLYRFTREPKRLWKRYSVDLAAYGAMVVREKIAPRKRGPVAATPAG